MNERNWLIVTGTGKKKILILNRMDYKSLDHKEWNTILKKYLNLYQFYILDIPEKLAQENYNFNNSNISYFAEEVVCFIKKKNLKFNAILGISLGGMICQQLLEYNEFKKTPKILVSTNVYASIKLKAIFSSLYKNLEFFGVNGFRIALESWVTKISDLPTFQCKEYNHIECRCYR